MISRSSGSTCRSLSPVMASTGTVMARRCRLRIELQQLTEPFGVDSPALHRSGIAGTGRDPVEELALLLDRVGAQYPQDELDRFRQGRGDFRGLPGNSCAPVWPGRPSSTPPPLRRMAVGLGRQGRRDQGALAVADRRPSAPSAHSGCAASDSSAALASSMLYVQARCQEITARGGDTALVVPQGGHPVRGQVSASSPADVDRKRADALPFRSSGPEPVIRTAGRLHVPSYRR